jgi:hypothetical protein
VPVWEVPRDAAAADLTAAVTAMAATIEDAAADRSALTAEERRAKAGLLNRQVTLR